MEFQHDNVPKTHFQTKSASVTRSVEPLLYLSYDVLDEGTSIGDEFNDFTRKLEVNVQWITRVDVEEFVDLRRESIRNNYSTEGDEEVRDEDIENWLLEEHINAYIKGDSGSNTLDYDELAEDDFPNLKQSVENMDESIDWGQLFAAERSNRDRDEVKDWINQQRREQRSIRYDTMRFSQLKNSDFYPERVGQIGFGFIGAPEVAYWDNVGTMIGFTPDAEERNTGEREEQKKYQEEMDEEYSNISCNFSSYQRVEKDEDGNFVLRHDKSLNDGISMDRFGWYFERTIPDDYLSRAAQIHGYDSNDEVVRAVYELVTGKISEVAEEYDLANSTGLPAFEEQISSELSLNSL